MQILVVDDDPIGLMVARTVVESLGHAVTVASDGEQAWQLLLTEPFDVVISDREMPGLDGLELCRRLRAPGRSGSGRPYSYVVLVTGHDAYADALEGMQAGADDYLSKPLDARLLRLRLIAAERVTGVHATLARQQRELAALSDAQSALARRDPLTALPNRRALQEELDRLDARGAGRYALALLDLDHFKSYNDAAGHVAGDEALRRVAAALAASAAPVERARLFRYGGEEFVLVVEVDPSDTGDTVHVAAERLRRAVRDLALPHPARAGAPLTVSAGTAAGGDGRGGAQAVLAAADTALFLAKREGRDQTRAAPTGELPVQRQPDAAAQAEALVDPAPLRALHDLGQRIGRGVAEEVVRTYLRQSDEHVVALQSALDTRADEALTRGAHSLRSSSATIGAVAVSRTCAALEQAHLWQRRAQLVDALHTLSAATHRALEAQLRELLVA